MKPFIIALLAMSLLGCSQGKYAMRTGTICVIPIMTTRYLTTDPVLINKDIVEQAALIMENELILELGKSTKMKYIEDCSIADLILKTQINNLDVRTDSHLKINPFIPIFSHAETEHIYNIITGSTLEKSNGDIIVADISCNESRPNFSRIAKEAAQNTVKEIKNEELEKPWNFVTYLFH